MQTSDRYCRKRRSAPRTLPALLLALLASSLFGESSPCGKTFDLSAAESKAVQQNPDVAHQGADCIANNPTKARTAFPVLAAIITNPSKAEDTVQVATWAAGRIAESVRLNENEALSVAPFLIDALNDRRRLSNREPWPPAARQVMAYTLGRLSEGIENADRERPDRKLTEKAVGALRSTLRADGISNQDQQVALQEAAAQALGRFRSGAQTALPELEAALITVNKQLNDQLAAPNRSEVRVAQLRAMQASLVGAIGEIGPTAQEAIPIILPILSPDSGAQDPGAERAAALAIRTIGPGNEAQAAVGALVSAIRDSGDADVRQESAFALGRVGRGAHEPEVIQTLETALTNDDDAGVREAAASALDSFDALQSAEAVPSLTLGLRDHDPFVLSAVARTLGSVSQKIASGGDYQTKHKALHALQDAQRELVTLLESKQADPLSSAALNIAAVQLRESIKLIRGTWLFRIYHDHPRWFLIGAGFLSWFLFLRFVMLPLRPLRLLQWNQALEKFADFPLIIPKLGTVTIPFRYAVLVGWFGYSRQVLDAWVDQYVPIARENLLKRKMVSARRTYVSLPVALDTSGSAVLSALSPKHLHATCNRERWCIRILGEGGIGKTSLACQLALWSMEQLPDARLSRDRRSIPILIEPGVSIDFSGGESGIRGLLRVQLRDTLSMADLLPNRLFDRLLGSGRLLVILDGASEMNQLAGVNQSGPRIDAGFPAAALIATARSTEAFSAGTYTDIYPQRIDTEHLSPFMNAYLATVHLNIEDEKLYDACRRLSLMVGRGRGITPLLAQLYAMSIVNANDTRKSPAELPATIPELMLRYIDDLMSHAADRGMGTREVHRAAKRMAWEAIRNTFRPIPGRLDLVLDAPEADAVTEPMVGYLQNRLHLIEVVTDGRYQFLLDPLAEYLGALWLLNSLQSNEMEWKELLNRLDRAPGAPTEILGFLVALHDALLWRGDDCQVPTFVAGEVARRIELGRRPAIVPKPRMEQGLERMAQIA